jgi:hypothetical protein
VVSEHVEDERCVLLVFEQLLQFGKLSGMFDKRLDYELRERLRLLRWSTCDLICPACMQHCLNYSNQAAVAQLVHDLAALVINKQKQLHDVNSSSAIYWVMMFMVHFVHHHPNFSGDGPFTFLALLSFVLLSLLNEPVIGSLVARKRLPTKLWTCVLRDRHCLAAGLSHELKLSCCQGIQTISPVTVV